ncbi:unnamed protein product, partial [Vitis vinifera]|uniref:Uncharacterized protein n=1 Tax=Vitis vinifera TaxID=29760 RepID=D7STU7_VITVI
MASVFALTGSTKLDLEKLTNPPLHFQILDQLFHVLLPLPLHHQHVLILNVDLDF